MYTAFIVCLRSEVLGSLCSGGQEGCGRIYRCLSQLLCLSELEEVGGDSKYKNTTSAVSPTDHMFLTSWQDRLKHFDSDFCYLEPVLSLRVSTLHSLILRERQSATGGRREASSLNLAGRQRVEQLFGSLSDTLLMLAKRAQDVGRYQVSI